ncbi:MAG: helix-turn-helix transcriptional regulator [Lawsonibacter sp.]|nr:helix-turn-helix transcriptional regulator [Lawsonibacter sp.]
MQLRKQRGISQGLAAEGIQCSKRAYQKYEYEESEPQLSVLVRIAQFYGVSLDYLAGLTDTP